MVFKRTPIVRRITIYRNGNGAKERIYYYGKDAAQQALLIFYLYSNNEKLCIMSNDIITLKLAIFGHPYNFCCDVTQRHHNDI